MTDVEVHIALNGEVHAVGLLRRHAARQRETVTFEYDDTWLQSPYSFAVEPALALTRGAFAPQRGQEMFGAFGDSAPDSWGRRLMQRAERHRALQEGRTVRTLTETDYLLGVSDETRLGALRYRRVGEEAFQAPLKSGVPAVVKLGQLLGITDRILRDEETDDDLQMIFAPGSSLGGARPKASVIDQHGHLSFAKFPKESDDYSIETWEAVALSLARDAGIDVPEHCLIEVDGRAILLSRRFDRHDGRRIPFLSAMSMTGLLDGEGGSYPELVDTLTEHGARAKDDAAELYRRVAFSVLVSNVDDHLRNHGFLWSGRDGWVLSPAYDLNPVPTDIKPRVLTTNIDLDEGTCSVELLESAAEYFGMSPKAGRTVIAEVARVTAKWRDAATRLGAKPSEIGRMSSAFEHKDLEQALKLQS